MTERTRVVITGLGIVCPVGNDIPTAWNNIVNGTSGVAAISHYDTSDCKVRFAAEVKDFDAKEIFGPRESRRMDRFTQFGLAAALEAQKDSGLTITPETAHRVGAVIGSGIGGIGTILVEQERLIKEGTQWISPHLVPMMLPDTTPGKLAIELGLRGPNMSIATACASGTNAIGEAAAMIRRGVVDAMFAGGAEAGIVKLIMTGFSNMGALSERNDDPAHASRPFDKDRNGFVCGEGAGMLVLESEAHAKARGAHIYAEFLGYGSSADAHHITAPLETGEGAVLAMRGALDDAGLAPDKVSYLNAHGTSTQLNDRSETRAVKTVFSDYAYKFPISSTKSMTGHLLGAAGAIEAIFSIKAIESGKLPPTINYETPDPDCDLDYVPNKSRDHKVEVAMSNSFGFGGHNACLIVGRYQP